MNELKVFENEEFGSIRTVQLNNETYFVGKDVATALGYKNPTVALQDNVEDEDKVVTKVSTSGGAQDATVINESGLYALIFGSKLKSAKKFKHWVTSEILPSIRKTGAYQTKPLSAMEQVELHAKALLEVNEKVDSKVDKEEFDSFKQDLPLLAVECDRITNAVKRKGVRCLGGKESNAYNDRSIRSKVYSDIHSQVKREFGVSSYKAIKRHQCECAVNVVEEYILPLILQEEVDCVNAE